MIRVRSRSQPLEILLSPLSQNRRSRLQHRQPAGPEWLLGAIATLAAVPACTGCDEPRTSTPSSLRPPIQRVALPGDALRGLSGLTRAPSTLDADFLSVAERRHHLIPIRVTREGFESGTPIPVRGVDPDLDLEGLALIDDEHLVFATEADFARTSEKVLFAGWHGREVRVEETVSFDYDPWGLVPTRNRGLEGLCVAGDVLAAASEMVAQEQGRRWSPVAVYDRAEGQWTPYRVFLTSDTGKLSGLACEADSTGGLTVTAIERHFDLLHLVRFRLEGPGGDVEAHVLDDLRPGFAETPPNFEGLERSGTGVFYLITDNDWRGVRGPTEMIWWRESLPAPTRHHAGAPGAR